MSKKSSHCNITYVWYKKFVPEGLSLGRTKVQQELHKYKWLLVPHTKSKIPKTSNKTTKIKQ